MSESTIAASEKAHEIPSTGAFVRQNNRFVTPFENGVGELPVQANRYRLLWAAICPWAYRQIIAFRLPGLDKVISVGTADSVRTEKGWEFSLDEGGVDLDWASGISSKSVRKPKDEREKLGITDNLIRVSAGLEDASGLIEDFNFSLNER